MVKDYEYFRVSTVGPNCILLQWKMGISDDLVLVYRRHGLMVLVLHLLTSSEGTPNHCHNHMSTLNLLHKG